MMLLVSHTCLYISHLQFQFHIDNGIICGNVYIAAVVKQSSLWNYSLRCYRYRITSTVYMLKKNVTNVKVLHLCSKAMLVDEHHIAYIYCV